MDNLVVMVAESNGLGSDGRTFPVLVRRGAGQPKRCSRPGRCPPPAAGWRSVRAGPAGAASRVAALGRQARAKVVYPGRRRKPDRKIKGVGSRIEVKPDRRTS